METLLGAPMEMLSAIESNNALITTVLLALIVPYLTRRVYQFFTRDYPNMLHYLLTHHVLRREVTIMQSDRPLMEETPVMNDELIEIILLYVGQLLRASSSFDTVDGTARRPASPLTAAREAEEEKAAQKLLFPFTVSPESLRYAGYRLVSRPRAKADKDAMSGSLSHEGKLADGGLRLAELLEKEYEISLAPATDVALEVEPGLFLKLVPAMRPWTVVRHERRQQRRLMRRLRTAGFFTSMLGGAAGRFTNSGVSGGGGENTLLGGPLAVPRGNMNAVQRGATEQAHLQAQFKEIDKAAKQKSAVMLASTVLDDDAKEFFLFSDLLHDTRLRMRDPMMPKNARADAEAASTGADAALRLNEAEGHAPNIFTRLSAAAQNGRFSADYDEGDSDDTDEESEHVESSQDDDESLDDFDGDVAQGRQEQALTVPAWRPRQIILQSRAFRTLDEEQQFEQAHTAWQRSRLRSRLRERAEARGWGPATLQSALDKLDECLSQITAASVAAAVGGGAPASEVPGSPVHKSVDELTALAAETGLSLAEIREARLFTPQSRVDQFLFRAVSWYEEALRSSHTRDPHFLMYPYAGELEAALQVRLQQPDDDDEDDEDDDSYGCYDDEEADPLRPPPNGGRLLAVRRYPLPEVGGKSFASLFFPQKEQVMALLDAFQSQTGKFGIPGVTNKLTILLHGPPGTGKTSLVKAMAHYLKRHVLVIPLTTLHTNGALKDWMSERAATCVGETVTTYESDLDDYSDPDSDDLEYFSTQTARKVVLRPHQLIYLLEDVDAVDWSDMQETETDVEKRALRRLQELGFTPLARQEDATHSSGGGANISGAGDVMSKHPVGGEDSDADSLFEDAIGGGVAAKRNNKKGANAGAGMGSDDEDSEAGGERAGGEGGDDDDDHSHDDDDEADNDDPAVVAEKKRKRMEALFQALFVQLERDRLSIDGILRVLNGVTVPASRITVLTTNHPEKLDARLLQPGVINLKINMDDLDEAMALEMVAYYFADALKQGGGVVVEEEGGVAEAEAEEEQGNASADTMTASANLQKHLQRALASHQLKMARANGHHSQRPQQQAQASSINEDNEDTLASTSSALPLKINPARLEQLCVECETVEELLARLHTAESRYGNVF